jgi:ABC-type Fe3+-hydroxamate transport system substrate-binding protein
MRQGPEIMYIGMASGMDMREVSKDILKRLAGVPAIRSGKVFYVGDGLYRLGPRIPQGIEELAESLKN